MKLKKIIYISAFTLLKIRTGVSFFLIRFICNLFGVVLVANYIKELNMVQLEIIPKKIERARRQEIAQVTDLFTGQGDPIPTNPNLDKMNG